MRNPDHLTRWLKSLRVFKKEDDNAQLRSFIRLEADAEKTRIKMLVYSSISSLRTTNNQDLKLKVECARITARANIELAVVESELRRALMQKQKEVSSPCTLSM